MSVTDSDYAQRLIDAIGPTDNEAVDRMQKALVAVCSDDMKKHGGHQRNAISAAVGALGYLIAAGALTLDAAEALAELFAATLPAYTKDVHIAMRAHENGRLS